MWQEEQGGLGAGTGLGLADLDFGHQQVPEASPGCDFCNSHAGDGSQCLQNTLGLLLRHLMDARY